MSKIKEFNIYKSAAGEKVLKDKYAEILSNFSLSVEKLELATSFGNTSVLAAGDKDQPPLILLHGSCSNALVWQEEMASYKEKFRIFAVDIIGEPGASAACRPDESGEDLALWLKEVLDELKLERAAIVGYSLGGWMAIKFASTFPEKVSKLILIASGGLSNPRLSFIFSVIMSLFTGLKGGKKLLKKVAGEIELNQEVADYMHEISKHFNPRISSPLFSDDQLSRLNMPVMFLGGKNDSVVNNSRSAERLKKLAKNISVLLLPNEGHVIEGIASLTMKFLGSE